VTLHPARPTAHPRPTNVDVSVSPDTGTRTVTVYSEVDGYVILIASRDAPDSLIDATAKIATESRGGK